MSHPVNSQRGNPRSRPGQWHGDQCPEYPPPGHTAGGYGPDGYPDNYDDGGYRDEGYGAPAGYSAPHPQAGSRIRQPAPHQTWASQRSPEEHWDAHTSRQPRRWLRLRLPGPGLVLTVLGFAVQVLGLLVLPWVRWDATGAATVSLPTVWKAATDHQTLGFAGWYVLIFSYPLAVLGALLALASVLQSVALKAIWGGLTLVGLGALAVRYGLGPFAEGDGPAGGPRFTTHEIITATVAVAAAVVVIFLLRTAVSTFRRLAALVLLAVAGVHVAAVLDLAGAAGTADPSIGAYAPAAGYLLTAIAALVGPRRLPGM
jgi:hypothetical protein